MRHLTSLGTLLVAVLLLASCNSDKPNSAADTSAQPLSPTTSAPGATAPAATAVNASFHYICSKGCNNGGDQLGNCTTCGAQLMHNDAYHSQNPNAGATTPPGGVSPVFVNPGGTTQPAQAAPQPADPPQNAAGVWHYTCPSGCAGGSGSPIACPTCGAALAHNQAYHN
ncbi:MAG: hypothetical protein H6555_10310 [Lewinellaceae bacterium]|nr:hypothetical protein [Lewinellaceae bacterium]